MPTIRKYSELLQEESITTIKYVHLILIITNFLYIIK